MGAWGAGIFDDDVAADVRAEWDQAVAGGLSPQQATAALIDGLGADVADDLDDGPVFWMALAALQLETGRIDPHVAAEARAAIPANLARWREDATQEDYAERERILTEFAGPLGS